MRLKNNKKYIKASAVVTMLNSITLSARIIYTFLFWISDVAAISEHYCKNKYILLSNMLKSTQLT